jgi:hypothetical protein
MTIVGVDGVPTEPKTAQSVIISAGQRQGLGFVFVL